MTDELRRRQGFPVPPMCRVLEASKSGYYTWLTRKPTARKLEDERLKLAIKAAHERGRGTYGPEKIQEELAEFENMKVGIIASRDCDVQSISVVNRAESIK